MLIMLLFKQKTAYEMHISDWSSDVFSSDLALEDGAHLPRPCAGQGARQPDRHPLAPGRAPLPGEGLAVGVVLDPARPGATRPDDRVRRRLARSDERRVGKECVSTCRSSG